MKQGSIVALALKYYKQYKEVIFYLVFGVLTTLVNIITYMIFADVMHIDYMVSTVIAWFVSVLFAYITNKLFVFESKTITKKELAKEITSFFAFRVLSGIFDMAFMFVTVGLLKWNDTWMKIVSNVFVIIANYVFSKLFIFTHGKEEKKASSK